MGFEDDHTHEDILGRIAFTTGGKVTYQRFSESISMLGYAATSDVFGASLYEPCGQIDQIGNIFGATATNRDTGGGHDKIKDMRLKADGAPHDEGNGFLFQNYESRWAMIRIIQECAVSQEITRDKGTADQENHERSEAEV